jgi:hypothetical protein
MEYLGMTRMTSIAASILVTALCVPQQALAVVVNDPINDFLPTCVGPQGGDLDVVSIDVGRRVDSIILQANLAAAVGTTAGALYVWGIDRGQGTARFTAGAPSVGAGVLFDSVVVLRPNGTGNFVDLLNAANSFALAPGAIVINGSSITGTLAIGAIPSTGFAVADFGYNLWPRVGNVAGNAGIADFAPDASVVTASFVPEPQMWAMLIAGFAGTGLMLRRRRSVVA